MMPTMIVTDGSVSRVDLQMQVQMPGTGVNQVGPNSERRFADGTLTCCRKSQLLWSILLLDISIEIPCSKQHKHVPMPSQDSQLLPILRAARQ